MSLLGIKKHQQPIIVPIGLFGAALDLRRWRYQPAISVLSALEGLNIAKPAVKPYVLPAAVVILVALFAIQPQGTDWQSLRSECVPMVFGDRSAVHSQSLKVRT